MDREIAARDLVYTNESEQQNRYIVVKKASQLYKNEFIIPMRGRSKKTDTAIPTVTVSHQRTTTEQLGLRMVLLHKRTELLEYCRCIAVVEAVLAFTSIVLMVIAEEIIFHVDPSEIRSNEPIASTVLKSIIAFLSLIELILSLSYWKYKLALYNVEDRHPESWRLALSPSRVLIIVYELLIIMIFPYPCFNRYTLNSNETLSNKTYVTPDVAVSLPMFLRLYFIYRGLVLHTQTMKNTVTGSISHMSGVYFSFRFVTRLLAKNYPFTTLLGLWVTTFLIGSWSYRACEFNIDTGHLDYSSACWLYSVSFTTIGYGDLYPTTDGGRIVSSIVGLWGIISVALVITIIQQYLRMSKDEKCVFRYNTLLEINQANKHNIGNVIKFTVKVWYLRTKGKDRGQEFRRAQHKVYQAIRKIRNLRRQHMQEFAEVETAHHSNQQQMKPQIVKEIQNRLNQLDTKLDHLTQLIYHQTNAHAQPNTFSTIVRL